MLLAYRRREADHVAVSPDISNMVPVRLSGRPFDEMYLDGRPHSGYTSASVAEAYVEAVRYYGFDGMYIYGSLDEIVPSGRTGWTDETTDHPEGGKLRRSYADTPYGKVAKATRYFLDEPPWEIEKPIKELARDWPSLRHMLGENGGWTFREQFSNRDAIGELGVYAFILPIPQDWWFAQRHGDYNTIFYDYIDHEALMDEVMEYYTAYSVTKVRAGLRAGPDEVWLGGSASSLSVSSYDYFARYDLPFIRTMAALCRSAGVVSHLHVCGRSRRVAELVASETDVDVIEPLEGPPGGDIDLADFKRRFGDRVCMKGNINTFDLMLNGTPAQVETEAKRLIDICAPGGGFVLSTGDQCGRDTPDANIFRLVEVAERYGAYR